MSTVTDYPVPPPDEEELLLSKLVFGDTTDFHENLANFNLFDDDDNEDAYVGGEENSHEEETADGEENEMDRVHDDQLFFVDDGVETMENDQNQDSGAMDIDREDDEQESSGEDFSDNAWSDSDDEHLNIGVTTTNRSKKLRASYQESNINGREYVSRLRSQFEKIYPRPRWVDEESEEEEGDNTSDEDEHEQVINGDVNALSKILESTYTYKSTSSRLLPPKTLDITRLKDANVTHPSRSAVQSLSFHPSKPLLLTGGYDRTLRIYHIDGKNNHLVTSLYLSGTPVQTCSFYVTPSHSEQKVFTGGRRRYMHSWDIANNSSTSGAKIDKISRMYGHEETQRSFEKFKLAHLRSKNGSTHGIILLQGNNGWINVLHATTGVWLLGCKIEGVLVDFCIDYQPSSNGGFDTILIAINTYGEIWEFSLTRSGKVIRKWKDHGGVAITTIQVGGGTSSAQLLPGKKIRSNRWLATGSESGFVNVYDRNGSTEKAAATLDQLTTTVSSLEFSPDGQILCIASRAAKDALRLVHLPTGTVFSNWPTSGTPLGKVTSVAFSPRGEMLAVGNEQGKVRLWRLNHY